MTTWIRKIRRLIKAFLSTDDNKYIVTDIGKKILMFDNSFTYNTKSETVFSKKDMSNTVLTRKDRASTVFTFKNTSPSVWTRKTRL